MSNGKRLPREMGCSELQLILGKGMAMDGICQQQKTDLINKGPSMFPNGTGRIIQTVCDARTRPWSQMYLISYNIVILNIWASNLSLPEVVKLLLLRG